MVLKNVGTICSSFIMSSFAYTWFPEIECILKMHRVTCITILSSAFCQPFKNIKIFTDNLQ